jgi:DNA invertase Pin-like site-specific DNA recombinase
LFGVCRFKILRSKRLQELAACFVVRDHNGQRLADLTEFERHLILARTTERRKRAQARGVRFGRKLKLTVHQQQEALARRAAGEALVDIARSYNVSHSTISRLGAAFTA